MIFKLSNFFLIDILGRKGNEEPDSVENISQWDFGLTP